MSGKQARRARQVKAPAPVRSKAAPARRKASPKVLVGAAVALVVLGGIVAAVFAFTGGSSSSSASAPRRGSLVNALPGAADVNRLFKGIPQHGNVLGSPKAPVTMVEYIDLQCPICQAFETQVMPWIVPRFVRTGKVKIVARPIAFIGPDSTRGRSATLAAARQNRLFNYAQILYDNQGDENSGWLDDSMVTSAAASIPGLDVPALLSERSSSAVAAQERQLDADATTDGVTGTPAIYVGKTGAAHVAVSPGRAPDLATLSAALDTALR